MRPTSYLNFGAGLVFLILGAIITMNWFASKRVGEQHAVYLAQQEELRILERLHTTTNRIVSSTNEFALIAMTSAPGNEAGKSAAAEAPDEDGGSLAAMQRERQFISKAVVEFQNAYADLLAGKPQSRSGADNPKSLGTLFDNLLKINHELLAAASSAGSASESVFELKERQEDTETALLESVYAAQKEIQTSIENRGGDLAADFDAMRNFELAAGLVAALILLASTVYISRRVGAMFTEIGDQRLSIEKANTDLNASMQSLKSLQQQLVDKEKFSTLGRLTATVSHELRNPLAAIRNSAFILKQGVAHLPELAPFTTRIERNITRCDHIIADLLEYTRSRALDRHPVDLCHWLETFAHEQELPPDVSLILELDSDPVMANLDEHRFQRAIVNLVDNACHAIASNHKPGTIRLVCSRRPDGAVIRVEDDGPGIPADIAPRIFDPLFTTKNFGAGLGLSIARNLVTEHAGTIEMETRMGKGTSFSIRLPAVENSQRDAAAA